MDQMVWVVDWVWAGLEKRRRSASPLDVRASHVDRGTNCSSGSYPPSASMHTKRKLSSIC